MKRVNTKDKINRIVVGDLFNPIIYISLAVKFSKCRNSYRYQLSTFNCKLITLYSYKNPSYCAHSNFDLIDIFNNTNCYLDDIFAVNKPDFYIYVTTIYPIENFK